MTVNKHEREERDFPDRKVTEGERRRKQNGVGHTNRAGVVPAQSGSAASVPTAMPQPPEIPSTRKLPHPGANPVTIPAMRWRVLRHGK